MDVFSAIYGHVDCINQIKTSIDASKHRNDNPPNFLLIGPAGVGKTTISKCISEYSDRKIVKLNCAAIGNSRFLIDQISHVIGRRKEPIGRDLRSKIIFFGSSIVKYNIDKFVLFLDEIHSLKKRIQTEILTLMDDYYILVDGCKHIFENGQIHFVAATTSGGAVNNATRRRFIDIIMGFPTFDEKVSLIKGISSIYGITVTGFLNDENTSLLSIAATSQAECVALILRLRDFIQYKEKCGIHINKIAFADFLKFIDLDGCGLNRLQRECLIALASNIRNKLSKSGLAKLLCLSESDYEELIERPLIQKRLIEIEPRGRHLTPIGIEVIKSWV